MAKIDVKTVQLEAFQSHVKGTFQISKDGDSANAALESAEELPAHTRLGEEPKRKKPFSLVFKCGAEYVAQGLYDFEHPEVGSISLFVTPFDAQKNDDGAWCYVEAVIN